MVNQEIKNLKVVCLGGGIGTVNLVKGLKQYFNDITVIVSTADEGGSSGRLRRLYGILPPGDLISCMAALSNKEVAKLLTYRFPGDRYGKDQSINGQKLGNLIMAALNQITDSSEASVEFLKKLFKIKGNFIPVTEDSTTISATTVQGYRIYGEEKIDLGKYKGIRVLDKVYIHPESVQANKKALKAIEEADLLFFGPGDLFTTLLPVMIIPGISETIKTSKAKKFFIVNVANKPFETRGYKASDYIKTIVKHIGYFPFEIVIINNEFSVKIPKKYHYHYVMLDKKTAIEGVKVVSGALIDRKFPLYHDPSKLAKTIIENI
jgi:uncharacterized cofD-like protein